MFIGAQESVLSNRKHPEFTVFTCDYLLSVKRPKKVYRVITFRWWAQFCKPFLTPDCDGPWQGRHGARFARPAGFELWKL